MIKILFFSLTIFFLYTGEVIANPYKFITLKQTFNSIDQNNNSIDQNNNSLNTENNYNLQKKFFLPSLIESTRINYPVYYCKEILPLNDPVTREKFEKEIILTLWDRPQIILWVKRSGRHMNFIEKVLLENNMPLDLKYIPVIESCLRPHAGSSKGAVGFWQFIKSTGVKYGLTINNKIDERRNIYKSTNAAIKYLKDLYKFFGSWTLATAAYNMGESGLKSEIIFQNVNDFYKLYLPVETQRYILKIITAKMILSNPEKYGFYFNKDDIYKPVRFEKFNLEIDKKTSISIIAYAANSTFKIIKELNPEIRGAYLYKNREILIPENSKKKFISRFNFALKRDIKKNFFKQVYTVKEGDNLASIADKFNITLNILYSWNNIKSNKFIYPGDKLNLYTNFNY